MRRLINATRHSARACRRLLGSEAAFQQEALLLAVALPVAWLLSPDWRSFALLIGAILLVMVVEVLNTAVEATCDAVSREFRPEIQLAKDCGSLAVAIAILIAGGVWLLAITEWFLGGPI